MRNNLIIKGSDYVIQYNSIKNTDWALLSKIPRQYGVIVNTTHPLVVERLYYETNKILVVLK